MPTALGFRISWVPFELPQVWAFFWWLGVAVDHHSRRVMNLTVYRSQPSSDAVREFLERLFRRVGGKPRHFISDQGRQFIAKECKRWCRCRGIGQRFGAIGKYGSLAVIERCIRTATPDKVHHHRRFACRAPRFEPRPRWPRRSRCAAPQTLIRGRPGARLEISVRYHAGRRHLPIVTLKPAA